MFFRKRKKINDTYKILGNSTLFFDENMKCYILKYKTMIFVEPNKDELIPKIVSLGFTIETVLKDCAIVYLPAHWTHILLNENEEIIVDILGRTRIKIDRKKSTSTILRRFNFGFNFIPGSEENNFNTVECYFTDCDRIVTGLYMPKSEYKRLWDWSGHSQDNMIKLCINQCVKILFNNFPEWKDETAYWSL
jgi:hypothetical protein